MGSPAGHALTLSLSGCAFLQGALLREMPWLATSIAATSLAAVGGVEDVTVIS
jgi:hypothetical protein